MSKKQKNAQVPKPSLLERLEKRWFVIAGIVVAVGWLLLNANTVLSNARAYPNEVRKTGNQLSSWYYDDAAWNGYWTSESEGYVDKPDMNLSPTPVAVSLEVHGGNLEGMISTKPICDFVPFSDFVLLRGHVDTLGSSATVVAWDTIEGHDQDFAKLKLKRNGAVITVEPQEGTVKLFPKARIALDPNTKEWPAEFCSGKRDETIKIAEQAIREARARKVRTPHQPAPNAPRR
jgi:hypothetical protein